MSILNTNRLYLGLALAGCVAAAPPAVADPGDGYVTQHVYADGLDLRSSAGKAMLHHRIAVAALNVCKAAQGRDLPSDCIRQARRNATGQADALIAAAQGATQVASAGPAR